MRIASNYRKRTFLIEITILVDNIVNIMLH